MTYSQHSTTSGMTAHQFCDWLERKLTGTASMSDRFRMTHPHWDAPPPIEPERIEDFYPTEEDIEANAGPTLVDVKQYVGHGPDAVEQTVTVTACVDGPPYWTVS